MQCRCRQARCPCGSRVQLLRAARPAMRSVAVRESNSILSQDSRELRCKTLRGRMSESLWVARPNDCSSFHEVLRDVDHDVASRIPSQCQRNRVTPAPVIDLEPVALAQGTYNFFNCCSVAGVVSPNLHGIYSCGLQLSPLVVQAQ